jgi:hypothetical protein
MTSDFHTVAVQNKSLPPAADRWGMILLVTGLVLVIGAYILDPVRASFNAVILYLAMVSIAVGSLFLIALEYITGAVWSVPMRRVSEFLAGLSPFLVLLAIPLFLHMHDLFHWTHAEAVVNDEILVGKAVVFLSLWTLFYLLFTRNSTKQDVTRDQSLTRRNVRLAAVFIPLFAISITFTAIDWAMSLEPHWFSTIYGVYYFSGTILTAVSAAT